MSVSTMRGVLATLALSLAVPVAIAQQPAQPGTQAPTPGQPSPSASGEVPRGAAPYLLLIREQVKPGRRAAHAANETGWAGAFASAKAPIHWLGMTTISGPNEAWFLEPHTSRSSIQEAEQALDDNAALRKQSEGFAAKEADMLESTSQSFLRLREDLSYNTDVALPAMRVFGVEIVHVKPGYGAEFSEAWRDIVAAHKEAKLDEHWAVYQVESGMPDGTYLFFYPYASLGQVDTIMEAHGQDAYRDAIGESGRRRLTETTRAAVESTTRWYFKMEPRMSHLPPEWAKADAYWQRPAGSQP